MANRLTDEQMADIEARVKETKQRSGYEPPCPTEVYACERDREALLAEVRALRPELKGLKENPGRAWDRADRRARWWQKKAKALQAENEALTRSITNG